MTWSEGGHKGGRWLHMSLNSALISKCSTRKILDILFFDNNEQSQGSREEDQDQTYEIHHDKPSRVMYLRVVMIDM